MATLFRPGVRPSFYHRACIPLALRHYFKGTRQVWRSLKTTDPDHARLLTLTLQASTQRLFLTLKREGKYMTPADIDRLIATWRETEIERLEDVRVLHPFDEDRRSLMADLAIEQHEALDDTLEDNRYDRVASEADALLLAAGVPLLDHLSLPFKRLCRRLLLAKREVLREEIDRWQGIYKSQPVSRPTIASAAKPSPPCSVLLDKYLTEMCWSPRSIKPFRAEWAKWVTVLGGDRPLSAVTKVEARLYKESLVERQLSFTTQRNRLIGISAVWKWAKVQGYVNGDNPFDGLAPSKKLSKKTSLKRRPFTEAELVTLFGSQEFRSQRDSEPSRYWVPLLCLFQFCRREEPAQLRLSDVQEKDGVPFLRIVHDPTLQQNVKNESSQREIPLHPSLIELGFLQYVEQMKDAGEVRVFPTLTKGQNGFADPIGKWFGRLRRALGVTDPSTVLHSLRKGGITHIEIAGCSETHSKILAGHAANSVHGDVYVDRALFPLDQLRKSLELLRFPEVMKALTLKKG